MKTLSLVAAALAMTLATPALAHRLIEANEAVSVARSDLTVTPSVEWNRISQRPGRRAERWTLDGELLNDVLFFAEIREEDTLFREVNRRERPLPEFTSNMLLVDIPTFLEGSLRVVKNIASFETTHAEPTQFLGVAGIRFEYTALGADDLARNGIAVASVIDGELFMMTYEAPAIHYFERDRAAFEQLVATAHLD